MDQPIGLLVNCAGRFLDAPFQLTEDGFEQASCSPTPRCKVHCLPLRPGTQHAVARHVLGLPCRSPPRLALQRCSPLSRPRRPPLNAALMSRSATSRVPRPPAPDPRRQLLGPRVPDAAAARARRAGGPRAHRASGAGSVDGQSGCRRRPHPHSAGRKGGGESGSLIPSERLPTPALRPPCAPRRAPPSSGRPSTPLNLPGTHKPLPPSNQLSPLKGVVRRDPGACAPARPRGRARAHLRAARLLRQQAARLRVAGRAAGAPAARRRAGRLLRDAARVRCVRRCGCGRGCREQSAERQRGADVCNASACARRRRAARRCSFKAATAPQSPALTR